MILVGAGETARLLTHMLRKQGVNVDMYVVDEGYTDSIIPSLGSPKTFEDLETGGLCKYEEFLVAITTADRLKARERLFNRMVQMQYTPGKFISPDAFVDTCRRACIGGGTIIFENNVLQDSVWIGDNTILWSGNHVGHGTVIGSHCFVSSHVVFCGGVRVGDRCFFGVNAAIAPGVTIGDDCAIGMGTVIMRNVPSGTVIRGVDSRDSIQTWHGAGHWSVYP